MRDDHGIILFDGVCNLCAWAVRFIVPRDAAGYFQFASLQSGVAEDLLRARHIDADGADSVVLIEGDCVYLKSDAALRIARHLDGLWSLAWALHLVPRGLRDLIYDWVAAHRYQIFGQRSMCLISVPDAGERFLEQAA